MYPRVFAETVPANTPCARRRGVCVGARARQRAHLALCVRAESGLRSAGQVTGNRSSAADNNPPGSGRTAVAPGFARSDPPWLSRFDKTGAATGFTAFSPGRIPSTVNCWGRARDTVVQVRGIPRIGERAVSGPRHRGERPIATRLDGCDGGRRRLGWRPHGCRPASLSLRCAGPVALQKATVGALSRLALRASPCSAQTCCLHPIRTHEPDETGIDLRDGNADAGFVGHATCRKGNK